MDFNIWDEDNPIIQKQYKKQNYIIKEYDNDSDLMIVYFAGNGIYYPDTEEAFKNAFCVDGDGRFEYLKYHALKARKEIYLRDIMKCWYVTGINSELNSPYKLAEFIRSEIPEGCKLVTVGNSAGGYAALWYGLYLGCDHIICISPQTSLVPLVSGENLLGKYQKERRDYLELPSKGRNSSTSVFFFYAEFCDIDKKEYNAMSDWDNVYRLAFNTSEHVKTMYNFNMPFVLGMNCEKLKTISKRINGSIVSRLKFSIISCGLMRTLVSIVMKKFKSIIQ